MPYLLDTNILLRLQEPVHPMHADAAHAIEILLTFDANDFRRFTEIEVVAPDET